MKTKPKVPDISGGIETAGRFETALVLPFFPQENKTCGKIPQQSKRALKFPLQVIFEKNPYT